MKCRVYSGVVLVGLFQALGCLSDCSEVYSFTVVFFISDLSPPPGGGGVPLGVAFTFTKNCVPFFPLCSFLTWNVGTCKPASLILSIWWPFLIPCMVTITLFQSVVLEIELRALRMPGEYSTLGYTHSPVFSLWAVRLHLPSDCRWGWRLSEQEFRD